MSHKQGKAFAHRQTIKATVFGVFLACSSVTLAQQSDVYARWLINLNQENTSYKNTSWKTFAQGFQLNEVNADLVRKFENDYRRNPDAIVRIMARGQTYLPYILDQVEKRGMPTELALLPAIESAFVYNARSPVGAEGFWQFMPGTARDMGLRNTMDYRATQDAIASTDAALTYLQQMYSMFGAWDLALAAYNWGPGNVQKSVRAAKAAGINPTYESIRLPRETRQYVPKLLAVRNVVAQPDRFNVPLLPYDYTRKLAAAPLGVSLDVNTAANLAGITTEDFRKLNPASPRYLDARMVATVLLPIESIDAFQKNKANWAARSGATPTFTAANPSAAPRATWSAPASKPASSVTVADAKPVFKERSVPAGTDAALSVIETVMPEPLVVPLESSKPFVFKERSTTDALNTTNEQPSEVSIDLATKPNTLEDIQPDPVDANIEMVKDVNLPSTDPTLEAVVNDLAKRSMVESPLEPQAVANTTKLAVKPQTKPVPKPMTKPMPSKTDVAMSTKMVEMGPKKMVIHGPPAKPKTHTVTKGDTLYNIADRYDLTVEELKKIESFD
jgi:membrane-bound lytic murein transglycosylase D